MSDQMIRTRIRSGRWERIGRGVYRIAGTPASWEQRLVAACLACPGALASHRAAGALWRLVEPAPAAEVIVPRTSRLTLPAVEVHRPRALLRTDRARRLGIPVTSPTRTLLDLAGVLSLDTLEEVLDDALARGLTSRARLDHRLRAFPGNGHRGWGLLRTLIDARGPGGTGVESRLETRLARLIRRSGLPAPRQQFQVRDGRRLVARVDFTYPEQRVAIEADGYRYHAGRARFERDRVRLSRLSALGWRVIIVTWRQLEHDPDAVVARVAALVQR